MRRSLQALVAVCALGAILFLFNRAFTAPGGTLSPMTDGTFRLSSPDFSEGARIPSRFTCDADGTPPTLEITGTPAAAVSLVLIVIDPDVPKQIKADGQFLHWLVFDIPPETKILGPSASVGITGQNGMGEEGYVPPCPPKDYEPSEHRYIFHLYALDTTLSLQAGASEEAVRQGMAGHIIAETELTGKYQRQ